MSSTQYQLVVSETRAGLMPEEWKASPLYRPTSHPSVRRLKVRESGYNFGAIDRKDLLDDTKTNDVVPRTSITTLAPDDHDVARRRALVRKERLRRRREPLPFGQTASIRPNARSPFSGSVTSPS